MQARFVGSAPQTERPRLVLVEDCAGYRRRSPELKMSSAAGSLTGACMSSRWPADPARPLGPTIRSPAGSRAGGRSRARL